MKGILGWNTFEVNVYSGMNQLNANQRFSYGFVVVSDILLAQAEGQLCKLIGLLDVGYRTDCVEPYHHIFPVRVLHKQTMTQEH